MGYVDGYVLPLPKKQIKTYTRIASAAGKIWIKHGALDYKECIGDDLKVKGMTSFTSSCKAKASETVVFAFVTYKSKKHRDSVNAKVMKDPQLHALCNEKNVPFDVKRMIYGGFKVIVSRSK